VYPLQVEVVYLEQGVFISDFTLLAAPKGTKIIIIYPSFEGSNELLCMNILFITACFGFENLLMLIYN